MRVLALAAFALAACATPPQNRAAGQPPEYQAGYRAGCDSGFVAAGHPYYRFNKDVTAYASVPLYKQGWDDGMVTCKGQYEAVGRALR